MNTNLTKTNEIANSLNISRLFVGILLCFIQLPFMYIIVDLSYDIRSNLLLEMYSKADIIFPKTAIILSKLCPVNIFFYSSNVIFAAGGAFVLDRPLSKRFLIFLFLLIVVNGIILLLAVSPYLVFCEPIDRLETVNYSFLDYFANLTIWFCAVCFFVYSYVKRTTSVR